MDEMKKHAQMRGDAVLSAAEMREVETAAMASGSVTGAVLMDRAGRGAVAAMLDHWPDLAAGAHRAVVLCGPGNNGGDGYVMARDLAARGWTVEVCALGDPVRLPPDAAAAHAAWCGVGAVLPLAEAPALMPGADVVIDALFGIGLSRPLAGDAAAVLDAVPRTARKVAVDVPSGRDADTGAVLGAAFDADLTVTFHAPKPVHTMLAAAGAAVAVVDIGLGTAA
ncbi:NAD(P)H-hydrate epimerase [Meridianimarinicoccus sp. RP-17]